MEPDEIHLRFTNNCNLTCAHCAYESSPGGHTMSESEIEVMLGNIESSELVFIFISGGEPLAKKKKLYQILDGISDLKKENKLPLLYGLALQTNGLWAKNFDRAQREMLKLLNAGVRELYIASNDKFHNKEFARRGVDFDVLYENIEVINELGLGDERFYLSWKSGKPVSFGRAKNLKQSELGILENCLISKYNQLTISPSGQVYPCCFEMPSSVGSILEEPLDVIINRVKNNRILDLLSYPFGLKLVAKELGRYDHKKKELYSNNPCAVCAEVFEGIDLRK